MKTHIVRIIEFLLLSALPVTHLALADAAAVLKQAEGLYQSGQYTAAEQGYLAVINGADPNKPADMEAAFNAEKKLPLVYLATDRLPQAKEAVQQLLNRHAAHESLPTAIHEIAEQAKPLNKLPQVRQLFQDLAAGQPSGPQALWLKMGIGIASAFLADDKAADASLQDITNQYAADPQVVEALNQIAWAYRKVEEYAKARTIYEHVTANWPQNDRAAFAEHGIVICYLKFGNVQAADAALEVLLQKYGTDRNISKLLLWAGHDYLNAGEHKKASAIYESLVRNYPNCAELIEAQASLGVAGVQMEDTQRIEAAVQTLLTQYPVNEAKATGLRNVANALAWKQEACLSLPEDEREKLPFYNKCLFAIASYLLANYPGSDAAMWAERELAVVAIQCADGAAAEAAITRLTTNYASHKDMPVALYLVGDYYAGLEKRNEAAVLYQYLIDNYPNHDLVPLAKGGLAQLKIREGDERAGEAILERLLADYKDHPRLAEAMNLVALGYYQRARLAQGGGASDGTDYYRKALQIWERVTRDLPQSPAVAQAYYHSAVVYHQELGEHQKALAYYQRLVDSWPKYEYAWHAQFFVGACCETLKNAGTIAPAEADEKIEKAYRAVLTDYPNCRKAGTAALKLGQYFYERRNWLEAAKHLELFLLKNEGKENTRIFLDVLAHLALVYEEMGQHDAASQVCTRLVSLAGEDDPRVQLVRASMRGTPQKEVQP
jgi:tetratricopeptide (TPR) repeat protein